MEAKEKFIAQYKTFVDNSLKSDAGPTQKSVEFLMHLIPIGDEFCDKVLAARPCMEETEKVLEKFMKIFHFRDIKFKGFTELYQAARSLMIRVISEEKRCRESNDVKRRGNGIVLRRRQSLLTRPGEQNPNNRSTSPSTRHILKVPEQDSI